MSKPQTLVVVAHPDLTKSRVNAAWVQALRDVPDITTHYLYREYPQWTIDVVAEQQLLTRYDRIILQFPFYWYNCPPLLKLWLDEVMAQGWAYGTGGRGALRGKELGIAVSTWTGSKEYQPQGRNRRTMQELTSPFEATARRMGMSYLPGFFLNGLANVDDRKLAANALAYRDYVQQSGKAYQ
ncbi:NAD(P)H-dependent oxidoreductase [Alcaligenes faecalis]|uniref:NAD(P)H-dependent oxidoreductase n=1 Tax=Alcaligenes faecalis TaxID=511 RepID=A0ABY7N3J3_ALCFA|nr:NAD(P)H-dependent oxidoreductase [Alcaligenes faecalis]WBM38683.1 NAD(P)H-dependent oxidoreductase [Alcaligenes faecalis]